MPDRCAAGILRPVSGVRLRAIRRFHWARDVEEALSLLAAYAGQGALLAGGVDLARSARTDLEGIIDITGIGLSYVRKVDGGLRIGATTTLTDLLMHSAIAEYLGGVLAETLRHVASPPLRNMATAGGAVVSAHPWADIPTALVALGAEVRWQAEREAHAPLEDLYRTAFRGTLRPAVVTEIALPRWEGAFAFEKVSLSRSDIALLNACCGLGLAEGRIAWARVALGATPDRAQRLHWVEEALVGEVPGTDLWQAVQVNVCDRVEVGDDRRASAAWRRAVAGALVTRALARAASRTD
ncbi:TPA: hypothetical protein DCY65_01775 [Candidatus Acetothermia bacterium]|nr:hypothetical protein [Candidatus Acetothermia bacterium]